LQRLTELSEKKDDALKGAEILPRFQGQSRALFPCWKRWTNNFSFPCWENFWFVCGNSLTRIWNSHSGCVSVRFLQQGKENFFWRALLTGERTRHS